MSETFDRAPAAISAAYNFQCGEYFATLLVTVAQAQTPSGARVSGRSTAVAFLNGVSVGPDRDEELTETMNSVARFPHITPNCNKGRPQVYFNIQEHAETWRFLEDDE